MRAFVYEHATIDHVQTRIHLTSIDIFVRMRAEDTPLSVQQDREPLLDMSASTERAVGSARATAGSAIQRLAVESQLQCTTTSDASRKGRD